MPVYEYKALDARGKKVSGIIDADSPRVARSRLRTDGFFPMEIRSGAVAESHAPSATRTIPLSQIFRRVRPQERSVLTRQMATLIGAGIPLDGADSSQNLPSRLLKNGAFSLSFFPVEDALSLRLGVPVGHSGTVRES